MTEEKSSFFKKQAFNLRHEGVVVGPEADGFLPGIGGKAALSRHEGRQCTVLKRGCKVRHRIV